MIHLHPIPRVSDWCDCESCGGSGHVFLDSGPSGSTLQCGECDGSSGHIAEPLCPYCDGVLVKGFCGDCAEPKRSIAA
jgi:DnaJ-class molecular chaperone